MPCANSPDESGRSDLRLTAQTPDHGHDPEYARRVTEPGKERPLALSFGAVAETYAAVRPRYFGPMLDRAQQVLELGPSARVLDLGAGTGRLTRELVQRFASVVAVEPDDERGSVCSASTRASE